MITAELRASARATYRQLFRAAATTFKGDDRVLQAFREKVRTDAREHRSITDAKAYAEQLQLGREVAEVLRKNVVQGVKVEDKSAGSQDTWRLRITKDTELGENDTIKDPPPMPKNARKVKCGGSPAQSRTFSTSSTSTAEEANLQILRDHENDIEHVTSSKDTIQHDNQPKARKLNYSALKESHKARTVPDLREEDIEETFVRGSGPGGQSINKTQNNVQLVHRPSGLRVTCQETRSLQQNRKIARKILLEKLDHLVNPGLSKEDVKRARENERERRRRRKARKKAKAKLLKDNLEALVTPNTSDIEQ